MNPLGLELKDIRLINKTVEQRNNIIHCPPRNITIENAKRYLATINKMFDLLENLE